MTKRLAVLYTLFAVIATAANIGVQDIIVRNSDTTYNVAVSVLSGTVVGLIVKYVLDKRYIFYFKTQSVAHDTQTFALYTIMGILTTIIFWSFEFSFHYIFQTKEMRYVGGVIGLGIGYVTKYYLDKRYVFRTESA